MGVVLKAMFPFLIILIDWHFMGSFAQLVSILIQALRKAKTEEGENSFIKTQKKHYNRAFIFLFYLSTHENDVCVRPQPIHNDLHHWNQPLIGQNLQPLREGLLTVDGVVAVYADLGVRVHLYKTTPGELEGCTSYYTSPYKTSQAIIHTTLRLYGLF